MNMDYVTFSTVLMNAQKLFNEPNRVGKKTLRISTKNFKCNMLTIFMNKLCR